MKLFAVLFAVFSLAQSIPYSTNLCSSEGRFADPEDCSGYIACVPDGSGSFAPQKGTCKGYAYNSKEDKCVESLEEFSCTPRQARNFLQSPQYDHLCTGNTSFTCANCKTFVTCVEGRAYEDTCQTSCLKNSVFVGVCATSSVSQCSCNGSSDIYPDFYSRESFFQCFENSDEPQIYNCPIGMSFDAETKVCLNINGLPVCSEMGIFAKPYDCTNYYSCMQTSEGWVQSSFSCSNSSLFYNEVTHECEDPCIWNAVSSTFICTAEGRFSNPIDCHSYIECIANIAGEFFQVDRSCPLKYYWNRDQCSVEEPATCKSQELPPQLQTCEIPTNCQ